MSRARRQIPTGTLSRQQLAAAVERGIDAWTHATGLSLNPQVRPQLAAHIAASIAIASHPTPAPALSKNPLVEPQLNAATHKEPSMPVTVPFSTAYQDVATERLKQDVQWGGASHDDQHAPNHWLEFIDRQLAKCIEMDTGHGGFADNAALTRQALVKIGALAVAGIQSIDRKEQGNG